MRFWLPHYAARRGCAYYAGESADGERPAMMRECIARWWEGSMLEVSSTRTAIAERLRTLRDAAWTAHANRRMAVGPGPWLDALLVSAGFLVQAALAVQFPAGYWII